MDHSPKSFITANTVLVHLINDNLNLMLFLEHFHIDLSIGNKTAEELCQENDISLEAFLAVANLYYGFYPDPQMPFPPSSLKSIVFYLKNSHTYYKEDKYPEIINLISQLKEEHAIHEVQLLEQFFIEYFNEVKEHLDYEDKIAFPYFLSIIDTTKVEYVQNFSALEYHNHHSDIETKLEDIKNLLLHHLKIDNKASTKRKLLKSLFDLEYDLKIHSTIEEVLLIPAIETIEKS